MILQPILSNGHKAKATVHDLLFRNNMMQQNIVHYIHFSLRMASSLAQIMRTVKG